MSKSSGHALWKQIPGWRLLVVGNAIKVQPRESSTYISCAVMYDTRDTNSGPMSVALRATGDARPVARNGPPGGQKIAIYARIYSRKTTNKVRFNASRFSKRRVSGSQHLILSCSTKGEIEKGPQKQNSSAANSRGLYFFSSKGNLKNNASIFLRLTKKPAVFFWASGEKRCGTRPSAVVAENGYFDQNVAPAQQLLISLSDTCAA